MEEREENKINKRSCAKTGDFSMGRSTTALAGSFLNTKESDWESTNRRSLAWKAT